MSEQGWFVQCFDGDTLDVRMQGGKILRVRLWGMDAPEHGQIAYRGSRAFLRDLCAGVPLVVRRRDGDRYGRNVCQVLLPDGRDVSAVMIRAGWAWWYRAYAKKELHLARLEHLAKSERLGIWAENSPVPPWAWRHGGRRGLERKRARVPGRPK